MTRPTRSFIERILLLSLVTAGLTACTEPAETSSSVYRVLVEQCVGAENQRATAVAIGPEYLVTVAHSFEQAKTITITDATGEVIAANVVYLDPDKDIAVVRTERELQNVLPLGEPEEGTSVSIATFADLDGPQIKDAVVLELVEATLDGVGQRAAIRLDAAVEPGDSGAAVVNEDEEMVGMVFAKARGNEIGWAIASSELTAAVELLNANRPEALPLNC